MLLHSLQRLQDREDVAMVVCVLPRDYVADPPPWIFQCKTDRLLLSIAGKERQDSVRNGLEDIPEECSIVLVQDAARPFFSDASVDAAIAAARDGKCAVPFLPMVDTVKSVDDTRRITGTVPRNTLVRVQTPQAFPRELLEKAHLAARSENYLGTDDSEL